MKITIEPPLTKPLIQKMCEVKYTRDYLKGHDAEYKSTSPYAVTDKVASSRISITPVTYTAMNPMNGHEYIDTDIERETIFKCPVTNKEFRAEDLSRYTEKVFNEAKRYGAEQAEGLGYLQRVGTIDWVVRGKAGEFVVPDSLLRTIEYENNAEPILKFLEEQL
jgi:hypothetical protein